MKTIIQNPLKSWSMLVLSWFAVMTICSFHYYFTKNNYLGLILGIIFLLGIISYFIPWSKLFSGKSKNEEQLDDNTLFQLASILGGGGDKGNIFPQSDVDDFSKGATSIPFEVTDARREGKTIPFIKEGTDPSSWYWKMPDGKKIYN